jgi:hypothetical protein
MSRKKKSENAHFPVGLIKKKVRGKWRFMIRKVDKKEFLCPIGTLETEAIDLAIAYNTKYRNPLINVLISHDPNNKPLSEWIEHLKSTVESEELGVEKISKRVFGTFCLDMDRLNELHGKVRTKNLTLEHVNQYLNTYVAGKSNNVYNAKISFLRKVFEYLLDEGAASFNFAANKKKKTKPKKERNRIDIDNYNAILTSAPHYLTIAISLSLQTTHSVNEVSSAKYSDCTWFKEPLIQDGLLVFGTLRIHRQKVKEKEASRVEIPITQQLKKIIEDSRRDKVLSPYIVHRIKDARGKQARELTHPTQCRPNDISEAFSQLRDKLGLYKELAFKKRPTFHEIRSLSIFLYGKQGLDPQERAAHTNAKTTKKYMEGHTQWVQIQAAELVI